ncbi:hypothetical protein [Pectinatus haikarae]|uniref:Uncharacterized protein n=1 Tax=Pectinatus haikarae TaxID=349096 RepID=A0ABT9Y538_9FIRM|nr:hypothetical protein [Pectinatus haikarae]MDQ0202841.1 hypothetical protein [Pectinatus haikarae]
MKITKKRFSISIPYILHEEYKQKAEYCGISLNKVIFYTLRRKRPVIVPKDVGITMLALKEEVEKLQKAPNADELSEIIARIKSYTEFFEKYTEKGSQNGF